MEIPTKSAGLPDYLGESIKCAGPRDPADSILEEKYKDMSEDSVGIPTKSAGLPDYLGECIKSAGPPDLADSILEEKNTKYIRGLYGNSHKVRSTAGL